MQVCKVFTFDAAHRLPGYEGKCGNLHGHTWTLTVGIEGGIDRETGMVMDFGDIGKIVKNQVLDLLDHNYLNNWVSYPTCENLLCWIGKQLDSLTWCDLKLSETEGNFCMLQRHEYEALKDELS